MHVEDHVTVFKPKHLDEFLHNPRAGVKRSLSSLYCIFWVEARVPNAASIVYIPLPWACG
jgi:hypothetical protein